jgi:hypothetical protein
VEARFIQEKDWDKSFRTREAVVRRRLILLVPLLALFAFVATTEERAEASDLDPVQGELMNSQLTGTSVGTSVVNDPMYQNGQALKFSSVGATATHPVTFGADSGLHDVVLLARAGQSGGSPTLTVSVNGTPTTPKDITNSGAPEAYKFVVNAPSGSVTIGVQAGNTATGRNAFVDVLSFPSSGGSTPPDADHDDVPDSTDQCPNVPGPAPTGCPNEPPSDWPYSDCEKDIKPGADIDNVINSDSSGSATTFCVYAGRYPVSTQATLKAGDKLKGEPGTVDTIDLTRTINTVTKPTPKVELVGSGTDNLLRADGSGISISWVDLTGAKGTGNGTGAIAAGSAGSDFLVQFARIHNNASVGISNMKGTVLDSEFFENSEADSSLGFNGSAVKGITEYVAGRVYVHEEQGNGLWCDVGCKNSARTDLNMTKECPTGCFWVYDSVVVNSGRAGIRYENSASEALFENNEIHGNGKTEWRGGIDIRDSQNATVVNNNFGPATITIDGVEVNYKVNGNRIGVRATDSGRSDRVNLSKVKVENNNFGLPDSNMNRDRIVTCSGQVVVCSGNTNVGTR